MKKRTEWLSWVVVWILVAPQAWTQNKETEHQTMADAYPGLLAGGLSQARLVELPEGILARSKGVDVTEKDMDDESMRFSASIHGNESQKHAIFILEKIMMDKLLLQVAKEESALSVQEYLSMAVGETIVTDQEVEEFFESNESMLHGAKLEQVKEQIRSHLMRQKADKSKAEHIRSVGEAAEIELSAAWVKEKANLAMDNPVDKARGNGRHSLLVFSSGSCCGPDRMLPLVEWVREIHGDRLNVIYVNARTDQLLCQRYGVQAIPTLVFLNEKGLEVSRNLGFLDETGIEERLAQMGVH